MGINEIHWSASFSLPLLLLLQLLPLAGALLLLLLRKRKRLYPLGLGLVFAELLLAVQLYLEFDHSHLSLQFAERAIIAAPLVYHAAVDGVSILFILLSALLTLLVVIYGMNFSLGPPAKFLAAVMLVESALMGLFTTQDLLWFFLLSVIQLAIVGHILWRWSTAHDRELAQLRYFQFMGIGLLLLFAGIMMLGWNHADATGGQWTFELQKLSRVAVNPAVSSLIFFLLFYGLGIRIPLFPLHGWLPVVAEHGSVAVSLVLLIGLKSGIYGLIRFVFPLLPEAVILWHPYVVTFAVAGVFYAAVLALRQVNMRRLLAFAVVSHTSVLLIGLFSLNLNAFQGSVMLSINFGLAGAGLLLMIGMVNKRTGTMLMAKLGGLFDRIPIIGVAFLIAGLAIVGMPGTPGFDAVHLVMEASIEEFGALVTVAAAVGNVVAAGFLLWAFQRAFLAPRPSSEQVGRAIPRTSAWELVIAGILVLVLMSAGFYSEPWLELIEPGLAGLAAQFEHR